MPDAKVWKVEPWANSQTLDKKDAQKRVIRVLKSFGLKGNDINHENLQRTIEALPYLSTTPSMIATIQYTNCMQGKVSLKLLTRTVKGSRSQQAAELSTLE